MSKKIPGTEVIWLILTSCYQKKTKKIPTTPSPTECGWLMVMGEAQEILLLPPPPPPLNLPGLRRSRKISATTPPPPPNLVGLWRSRKIGPPQKKILATPLSPLTILFILWRRCGHSGIRLMFIYSRRCQTFQNCSLIRTHYTPEAQWLLIIISRTEGLMCGINKRYMGDYGMAGLELPKLCVWPVLTTVTNKMQTYEYSMLLQLCFTRRQPACIDTLVQSVLYSCTGSESLLESCIAKSI